MKTTGLAQVHVDTFDKVAITQIMNYANKIGNPVYSVMNAGMTDAEIKVFKKLAEVCEDILLMQQGHSPN